MRNKIILLFIIVSLFQYSGVNAQRITLPNGQTPFFSGMNVAWRNFGGDIADTPANLNDWKKVLDEVKAAGGNTVRWWLFVNCSQVPKFDANGYVSGLGSQSINNVKAVLDLAQERNMVIILCLFSFDMLQTAQWGVNEANNKKMLQTDAGITASINKAVVPLVTAIGNHPSILCWEIFNEPEGMTSFGWTPSKVGMYDIQRYVNRAAGAIHRAVPGVKVSNGSWNMKVLCNLLGYKNYYSDAELKAAGSDADGYLDFYMVHYYNNDGGDNTQHSPFHHPSSYWGLNKPILVAEYTAKGFTNPNLTPKDCFQKVYDNNYAGALAWTYTAHDGLGGLPEATPGIKYLYDNHKADVTISFVKLLADAGANQIVYDVNYNDNERITLDGSGSKSNSGILNYVWKENGKIIATSVTPSITFAIGVHNIVLTVTDNVNPAQSDTVIITVKTPSLSYKKPVEVTSNEVGVNIATNAVDGDTATRWASLAADPQSITVDLQAVYKVNSIILSWETASAKSYTVETSLDGITFVTPALLTKTNMATGSRVDNLTGFEVSARFIRVTGTTRTSVYGYSLYEFEVWGEKPVPALNLAIGKPVVVSSTEAGFGNIATNVNDENLNTRWSSEYTDPQTIYIDLLENYNVTLIVLNWEIANAKSYTIEFSTDAITWTNPISKAAMAAGLRVDVIPVNSVKARYVRVTGLTRNTLFGYSLYEFEIYGSKALVTQTIQLQKGWNLLSTNLVVSNNQIQTVFAGLDVEMVKNSNGFWKKGQIQALNSLQTVSPGEGYLVKMNVVGTLTIVGTPIEMPKLDVSTTGWNIIGCPYQTTTSLTSLFNASNTQIIKNFDGYWIPNDALSTISSLVPGEGYYIKK